MANHWAPTKGVEPDKRLIAYLLGRRFRASGVQMSALVVQTGITRSSIYKALDGTRRPPRKLMETILSLKVPASEASGPDLETEKEEIRDLYEVAYGNPGRSTPRDELYINRWIRKLVALRSAARTSEQAREFVREAARDWHLIRLAKLVQRLQGFAHEAERRVVIHGLNADDILLATADEDLDIISEEVAKHRSPDELVEFVGEYAIEGERGGMYETPDGRLHLAPYLMSYLCVAAPLTGSIEHSIAYLEVLAERRQGELVDLYVQEAGTYPDVGEGAALPDVVEALRQSSRLSHLAEVLERNATVWAGIRERAGVKRHQRGAGSTGE